MVSEFDAKFGAFSAYQRTPWGRLRYQQVLHNLTPHLPDLGRPLHLLDAGGGNGLDAVGLAVAGHQVTVLDSSHTSLTAARTHSTDHGVADRVHCMLGDLSESSRVLAGRTFDVVLCHNVIQYLSDVDATVAELAGMLRPAGVLSVLAPNPHSDPLTAAVRSKDLQEALRLLETSVRFSLTYDRDYTPRNAEEVIAAIVAAGLNSPHRYGVRTVCDLIADDEVKHDPRFFADLVRLENALAGRRPYLEVARFFHLIATKPGPATEPIIERGVAAMAQKVRTAPNGLTSPASGAAMPPGRPEDREQRTGRLVVIRGNSGSGKSTVAKGLQLRFDRAECLVIPQDIVRREFLRESDVPDGHNIELIRDIAQLGLARGVTVVVEGILSARRYGAMLEQLASRAEQAWFYAFDLSFAETLLRHAQRPQAMEFGVEDMRAWYHGWDPLGFVTETRIDAAPAATDIVERIYTDITQ